jgi:hypothetical protein
VDIGRLRTPVLAYVASRATVLVAMWLADVALPDLSFFDLAKRWDGVFYYDTARTGYPHELPMVDGHAAKSTIAFFPLFPMAARVLAVLPGIGPLAAAVAISLLGGLVATLLVWRLAEAVWDRPTADRAAVLFAFFPGSFVFSIAYSEGLTLALCAGCLLLLHRQQWLLAGVVAALATATRPNALALVPAVAVAAFLAIRSERRWSALLAPALAPLGFVAFQVFLRHHTGRWDAWTRTQSEGWGQDVSLLATPNMVGDFLSRPFSDVNITLSVAGAILGLAGFALLVRARPPAALLVFTATILLLSLSSEALGVKPRFLLTAFPLVYGLARPLRREALSVAVGAEATILGTLTFVSLVTILATP